MRGRHNENDDCFLDQKSKDHSVLLDIDPLKQNEERRMPSDIFIGTWKKI
jgi:hypothetical protein